MNRAQRRSANKVRKKAMLSVPEIKTNPIPPRPRFHFWLGVTCLLRSPIESLKALGMFAEMSQKDV